MVNVTESINGSFYVMIRKKRGKFLGELRQKLFETVKGIPECVNKHCSRVYFNELLSYVSLLSNHSNHSNYSKYHLKLKISTAIISANIPMKYLKKKIVYII